MRTRVSGECIHIHFVYIMATHNQVQIGETNGGDFSASESLPILSGRSTACTASVKRRRERLASWDDSIPHSKRYEHSTT